MPIQYRYLFRFDDRTDSTDAIAKRVVRMRRAGTDADLWQRVEMALRWHRSARAGDRTGVDALNRLFDEHMEKLRTQSYPRLGPETCSIRSETWHTEKLAAKLVRWHLRALPHFLEGPIIAVAHDGHFYVIDGNNRVNFWTARNDDGEHEILIIGTDSGQQMGNN